SYASAEAPVLGLVLRAAVGRPLTEYLREKIWQPIGAEADATWLVDRAGQEATYCCINAVLRDYARLAVLLAHDGNWRGRQIIPAWIAEATRARPEPSHLKPGVATPFFGYGYQTWIFPGGAADVRPPRCARSDDPRRSHQSSRYGPHRSPLAALQSGPQRAGRALADRRKRPRHLTEALAGLSAGRVA